MLEHAAHAIGLVKPCFCDQHRHRPIEREQHACNLGRVALHHRVRNSWLATQAVKKEHNVHGVEL